MKGQNQYDTIFNDYYLPPFINVEHCGYLHFLTDDPYYEVHNYHILRNHYMFESSGFSGSNRPLDRAQPRYTDSLLTIQGIAIGNYSPKSINNKIVFLDWMHYRNHTDANYEDLLESFYNTHSKGKLKIINSTLDREIASLDLDTNYTLISQF